MKHVVKKIKKYPGKSLGLLSACLVAIILVAAVLCTNLVRAQATEISLVDGEYSYYTSQDGKVVLPLDKEPDAGENIAVFEEGAVPGEYSYLASGNVLAGDNPNVELNLGTPSWTEGTPAKYYVAVTTKDASLLVDFTSKQYEADGFVYLQNADGSATVATRPILINFDQTSPSADSKKMSVTPMDVVHYGDTVKLSFELDEPAAIASLRVLGKEVDASSFGSEYKSRWELSFLVPENIDESYLKKALAFSVKVQDHAGNEAEIRSDAMDMDKLPVFRADVPALSSAELSTNGKAGYAKVGDIVTLTLTYSKAVTIKDASLLGNKNWEGFDIGASVPEYKKVWTLTHTVLAGENGDISLLVQAVDEADNELTVTENDAQGSIVLDTDAPTVTNVTVAPSDIVHCGDTIQVSFHKNDLDKITSAKILGQPLDLSTDLVQEQWNPDKWSLSYRIPDTMDESKFGSYVKNPIDFSFTVEDEAGNQTVVEPKDATSGIPVFRADAPTLEKAVLSSNNSSPEYAKEGDTVTLTLTYSKPVKLNTASLNGLGNGQSWTVPEAGATPAVLKKEWKLSYQVPQGVNGTVAFQVDAEDEAGNLLTTTAADGAMKVDTTAPLVEDVTFISNNTDDTTFVEDGNSVTLTFTCSEESEPTVQFYYAFNGTEEARFEVTATKIGAKTYKATLLIESGSQKYPKSVKMGIYYKIMLKDKAGNLGEKTVAEEDMLRYSREKFVSSDFTDMTVSLLSKGESKLPQDGILYAKAGDTVCVSFKAPGKNINVSTWWGGSTVSLSITPDLNMSEKLTKSGSENNAVYKAEFVIPENVKVDGLASISMSIREAWGNKGQVEVNRDSFPSVCLVQYFAPIEVNNLNFMSSNQQSSVARDNDIITISFETQHPASISSATIAGQAVNFTSDNNKGTKWTAAWTVRNGDIAKDLNEILFEFEANDLAGNHLKKTQADAPKITYYAPLVINDLKFFSSNEVPGSAKNGDRITISFTTQHRVKIEAGKIAGQSVVFQDMGGGTKWQAVYTVNDGDILDNAEISMEFSAYDYAGNTARKTQADVADKITYYSPIRVSDLSFASSNKNNNLAKDGDTVTISFKTQHPVAISKLQIAGFDVEYRSEGEKGMNWTASWPVENGIITDNTPVSFSFKTADTAGNTIEKSQEDLAQVTYYAPISNGLSNLSFTSNNDMPAFAKTGDEVELKFSTTHPVTVSNAEIAGQQVELASEDGLNWTGVYQLERGNVLDNTDVPFTLNLSDDAGNDSIEKTAADASAQVRYQAPLFDSITGLTFVSNNTKTPNTFAKNGDVVTLTFQTSHPVSIENASIAGHEAAFTSKDGLGQDWTAVYTVAENDISDNTDIPFSFTMQDAAKNVPHSRTQEHTALIRYQAPIVINGLGMVSNNQKSGTAIAKNDDTVTVTFTTLHPVQLKDTTIAGHAAEFKSWDNDGMNWTAQYRVQNGYTNDTENILLHFAAEDAAGNTPSVSTQNSTTTEKIRYFAPLTVTDTVITANNSKDGTKYTRDGDTITVRFTTNHDADLSNVTLGGRVPQSASQNRPGSPIRDWTLTYSLQNGDVADLQTVPFTLTANDIAGNPAISKSNTNMDVTNSLQYFAPITAQTSISSAGGKMQYAKNGDVITIRSKANHSVTAETAAIGGRAASVSGNDTQELSLAYQIPAGDGQLPEGLLPLQYEITDKAGNRLSVTETNDAEKTQVTYDRTSPAVSLTPDFTGFTNKNITFTATFQDTNLNAEGISILVNGAEIITQSDRASIGAGATSYQKTFEISTEDEYEVVVTAKDMANNASVSNVKTSVTVDKTNPEIKTVNIDMGTAKTFKSGFLIGEYFQIDEKYVKEVICTVTDNDGVHDWSIDTPITTDGKKTIYLMVTDMAGNTSAAVTYDLYIDGTAPKAIVKDTISGRELSTGKNEEAFLSVMTLDVRLDQLHISGETPDRFTVIKLLDAQGNLVEDLMQSAEADGGYKLDVKDFGEYTLHVEALDDVGNELLADFSFVFQDKSLFVKYYENKALFYSTVAVAGVAVTGGGTAGVLSIRRIRKRKLAALKK